MSEMRTITAEELAEILRKHAAWVADEEGGERANLYGANLRGANLSSANLRGADLSGANLSGANLRGADLYGATLRGANLSSANLYDANLSGADLSGADLSGANLSSANLRGATLSRADLYGATLLSADLSGANLSGANLILGGQDIRGYLFYAFHDDDNVVVIRAGCRRFVGIAAARAHWEAAHTDAAVLHEDCLSLVDRIERMAKVRGWKL